MAPQSAAGSEVGDAVLFLKQQCFNSSIFEGAAGMLDELQKKCSEEV